MIVLPILGLLYILAGIFTSYAVWHLTDFGESKYKIGDTSILVAGFSVISFFFWPLFLLSIIIWLFWLFFKTN